MDNVMMKQNRLVVAGTESGAGKTTVTIGLMAALRKKGYEVQGFKCGPDYIDPTYHTTVTGRPSRNLDSWLLGEDGVKEIFARGAAGADVSVIEGVMGFYDGRDVRSLEGSTAHIAKLLDSPVVLVVDCGGMARSAAAIVRGFQVLEPGIRIAAVFANRVGSERHYRLISEAVERDCGIPVIGYLTRDDRWTIPERQLGLVPSIEQGDLAAWFEQLGDRILETTDVERLVGLANAPLVESNGKLFKDASIWREAVMRGTTVPIAVARDAAFPFYYPDNLELLEAYGAELRFFSPLADEAVPEGAQGLYLGGGYPERFAGQLSQNTRARESIRAAAASGMPVLAEAGGYMYMAEELVRTDGRSFPMLGLIQGRMVMQSQLAALGYREVRGISGNSLIGAGELAKGHEFHCAVFEQGTALPFAYESKGMRGVKQEGCLFGGVVAGFVQLHFASNPGLVVRWLELGHLYGDRTR
jgi:cobyrinic acid a,c-diamide synthase